MSFAIRLNYAEVSQRIFKRMVFSATSWPNLVYKMAPMKVTRAFDCVGQCQLESSVCNICFFDLVTQQCWLATLGANNTLLAAQNQAMAGYADLGMTKFFFIKPCSPGAQGFINCFSFVLKYVNILFDSFQPIKDNLFIIHFQF